ncbi:hypothetical protein ACLMJK_003302 [Lecanora helva]
MAAKKIVVVFGATGNQGGSVITSILRDPKTSSEYKLHGITRDTNSAKAKALEAKGVECVAADINSKDQIKAALQGAYAVFAVTNYWDTGDAEVEIRQGKDIADASKVRKPWAAPAGTASHEAVDNPKWLASAGKQTSSPAIPAGEANVQHLIWSGLYNITKLTNGAFPNVDHFDSKAIVSDHIRSLGIPHTIFQPGFFMSNLPGGMMRELPPNNAWTLAVPMPDDTPLPLFDAAEDTGKFVKAILTHRDTVLGKNIHAATDYYTPKQVVATFKELYPEAGKDAKFFEATKEQYKGALGQAGMPEKAQQELYENMSFMHDYGYFGKADLADSHAILSEKLTTLKEFFASAKAFEGLK